MGGEIITFGAIADMVRQTVQPKDVVGMPYIGLEHIEEGTLRLNGYGQAEDVTSAKFRFSQGDILFGKLRPYFRKVIRAPFDGVCSTDIWVVRAKAGVEQDYLFYWMADQDFVDFATQGSEGTKMPRAKWEHVCRYRQVRLPLDEQRAIAHILGTLDDKIELNRQMNRTLEAMARAVFKSWFVDFDPVRAKAAVRREHPTWSDEQVSRAACPKLNPEIAALFPDSFQDSELGEIPKGWGVGKLGDIVQIHDSKRIPLSSRERAKRQGPYRYYGAAGIVDYVDDFLFDGTYVLVGEDGSVVTDLGNLVVQYVWGKFWVNNHAHVLKAAGSFSDEHLLLVLQQVYVVPFVTGAVQPKLSQTNMNAIPILRAKPEVNMAFNKLIEPIFAKVRTLHDEIGLLAALRDALLPKLLSGEIRVKDAERFSGEVI